MSPSVACRGGPTGSLVETSAGPIAAGQVVLTGGPKLAEVGRLAGIRIPVGGARHQVAVMRERLDRLVPVVAGLGLRRLWAATIDYTPDHLPIIGPALGPEGPLDGVTVACAGRAHRLRPDDRHPGRRPAAGHWPRRQRRVPARLDGRLADPRDHPQALRPVLTGSRGRLSAGVS